MNTERKLNEDYLLLLVDNDNVIDTKTIDITKHFSEEMGVIVELCKKDGDNIEKITNYIESLMPKFQYLDNYLPLKYSIKLDELGEAFTTIDVVDLNKFIKEINSSKKRIFEVFEYRKKKEKEKAETNFEEKLEKLEKEKKQKLEKQKKGIIETIKLYFNAYDIEIAYDEAEKVPNMLAYSHRYGGWSDKIKRRKIIFEHNITENLKQIIDTNFGYGSTSYFFVTLIYKGVEIIPFSEWIDYRYAEFSQIKTYTRKFYFRHSPFFYDGEMKYRVKIENENWFYALEFTKKAANISRSNEDEFIEKYIIKECEKMVAGLENIYEGEEFDFLDDKEIKEKAERKILKRSDFNGFELISFETEKIIGALDFIDKIIEYNSIVPTQKYVSRIIDLCEKFIPKVHRELKKQKSELKQIKEEYNIFIKKHNLLLEKKNSYQQKKNENKYQFELKYKEEYADFEKIYNKSFKELLNFEHKRKMRNDNIKKLNSFIAKYNEWDKKETSR
jgi:hypothetical protein